MDGTQRGAPADRQRWALAAGGRHVGGRTVSGARAAGRSVGRRGSRQRRTLLGRALTSIRADGAAVDGRGRAAPDSARSERAAGRHQSADRGRPGLLPWDGPTGGWAARRPGGRTARRVPAGGQSVGHRAGSGAARQQAGQRLRAAGSYGGRSAADGHCGAISGGRTTRWRTTRTVGVRGSACGGRRPARGQGDGLDLSRGGPGWGWTAGRPGPVGAADVWQRPVPRRAGACPRPMSARPGAGHGGRSPPWRPTVPCCCSACRAPPRTKGAAPIFPYPAGSSGSARGARRGGQRRFDGTVGVVLWRGVAWWVWHKEDGVGRGLQRRYSIRHGGGGAAWWAMAGRRCCSPRGGWLSGSLRESRSGGAGSLSDSGKGGDPRGRRQDRRHGRAHGQGDDG